MSYAENTTVTVDKSRTEIERTLRRYGADQFMYGYSDKKAGIQFRAANRVVKFILPLPSYDDFRLTPTGRERAKNAQEAAWEQECRRKWRALALTIKAKLEAVESGISIFDEEFMAHIVLPDGTTMGETYLPQIAQAYESGAAPKALPGI